ncbi:glutathionylspermidine synthase family protein [Ketobacter sp.]|uniref:glutathionylspermidine synthase family protein n=1 Tax=Ketobacter sp. TaxID=2083498 RepID=UPI000F28A4D8|nr:glutathionylspermidine synthase family protein [Ketobacter sp.]RLU01140.1 MAG: CHAP domain-containing protein [Ketobacter sp.]
MNKPIDNDVHHSSSAALPFGAVIGLAPGGVASYSSDYNTVNYDEFPERHAFNHYVAGVYTGHKWQCVEFARRWLLVNRGYVFEDIAMAYDIFYLRQVKVVASGEQLPLASYLNGSKHPPEVGCLMIWQHGGEFEVTGHVAVVTEVTEHYVRIAEQNFDHKPWPQGADYSRELFVRMGEDGSYWVRCSAEGATILGWVIQGEADEHAEHFEGTHSNLFNLKMQHLNVADRLHKAWINLANDDEYAYAIRNGQRLSCVPGREDRYVTISQSALDEVERATNELNALFQHATDYVFQNPQLHSRFNIPEILWPRMKQSWDNRRNQLVTGRFDFTLSEQGLKVYEYNADSASCHMECGKIQGVWANHFGLKDGRDPGGDLYHRLVEAWKHNDMTDLVHIMLDHDQEESYHAQYMKSAMERAGLQVKLIQGVRGLQWSGNGDVLDQDGVPITQVWKTWAWETALDQLREELAGAESGTDQPSDRAPRLKDVLLHPQVMVIEPLWTLIPSNKAILPILWEMMPDHPYLLESCYELTPSLKKNGYVSKPIAGRCGLNISLVDANDHTLVETDGRFSHQDYIYQQLAPLPRLEDVSVQVCSFTAGGHYGGACVRVDESLIITNQSDILPLRVYPDSEWDGG